jgi:hypothetical protein
MVVSFALHVSRMRYIWRSQQEVKQERLKKVKIKLMKYRYVNQHNKERVSTTCQEQFSVLMTGISDTSMSGAVSRDSLLKVAYARF